MNFLSDDVLTTGAGLNTGAGTGGGFTDLLQNKLFLQYLSGAGSALQQGQPIGPALNQITQQNISAQNYMGLLKKLLGSDESKGTFSSKGINLTIPVSELKNGSFLSDNPLGSMNTPTQPFTPTSTPSTNSSFSSNQTEVANPFVGSQSGISASDLAGLSTQDIGNILSGVMNVEQLKQKKVSDVIDSLYKRAQIEKMSRGEPLDQPFPVSVPGIGKVSHRQWSNLPEDERRYALFVNKAKQLGDQDIMSKEEFEVWTASMKPSERTKFLKDLIEDPKLMKAEIRRRQAGATNISLDTKLTEKKAMSELGGQLYFNDPKWTSDLGKHMEKADFANVPGKAGSAEYIANVNKAKMREKINFIESKIVGGGGSIIDVKKQGKMGIWTVKWPSGDTKEIRYGLDE